MARTASAEGAGGEFAGPVDDESSAPSEDDGLELPDDDGDVVRAFLSIVIARAMPRVVC